MPAAVVIVWVDVLSTNEEERTRNAREFPLILASRQGNQVDLHYISI